MPNREIDNNASKYRYRDRIFDGKKSAIDEYTGKRIFVTKSHPMEKKANVDHVTPIAVIKERYKDLSVEQLRQLANSESNYAITNARLNSVEKNAIENHEYLAKKASDMANSFFAGEIKKTETEFSELMAQAPRMLLKEGESRINMDLKASEYRIKNAVDSIGNLTKTKNDVSIAINEMSSLGKDFMEGATENFYNSAFPFMILGVQNICEVASGQKTFGEAGKEMTESAVETALIGGGMEVAKGTISEIGQKLGSDFLKKIAVNSNEVAQVITIGTMVFQSFVKLVNDEISGEEFFEEIGEKGVHLAGDLIGTIAGGGIMSALLPATVAAGPAFVAVSASILVGAMVISTVCTEIYRYAQKIKHESLSKEKIHRDKMSRINRLANMALMEIQYQQQELKQIIVDQNEKWAEAFDKGFRSIAASMINNDFEQMSEGINHILNVFGEAVLFKNMDEFDSFFFDDNAVLNL